MNQYEKRARAIDEKLREHITSYKSVLEHAKEEGRQPSDEDRAEIGEHMQAIEVLKEEKSEVEANIKTLTDLDDLSRNLGPSSPTIEVVNEPHPDAVHGGMFKSIGEQFTDSAAYKDLINGGIPGGEWKSAQASIDTKGFSFQTKGTLGETTGGAGPAGGLTPPTYRPGIVETLYERLTIADLIPQAQTDSPVIRYVVEGTATSGAAGVSEAAAKPESTLGFTETSESVQKIATLLPVTDEMLEDAPQIQGYINQRLGLFIRQKEEAEILAGGGTPPDLDGLLHRSGVSTWARGTVDNNAVAVFKGANGVRGSAFLEPDAVVMNPANWQTTRLLTDSSGQFFGGGPFQGAYGGPQGQVSSNYPQATDLWGMRLVVTNAIGAGTALVGAFGSAAQIFRRSGLTVEATNSHASYFASNITTIRAESRLGLAVYRPSAFVKITGLS